MQRKHTILTASVLSLAAIGCQTLDTRQQYANPESVKKLVHLNRYFSLEGIVREKGQLYVGASAVEMTPYTQQYLAGFDPNRKNDGILDELFARTVVVSYNNKTVALVSLDLIGLMNENVQDIRSLVKSIRGNFVDDVVIASSHTHSGPDTLGLWGPSISKIPLGSGIDRQYLFFVYDKVAESVYRAAKDIKKAQVQYATKEIPASAHIAKNVRKGYEQEIDRSLVVLQFSDDAGKTIATVSNAACHPEVLGRKNKCMSSDFVGEFNYTVEREYGGVSVFLNQSIGGMITPDRLSAPKQEETLRIGRALAHEVFESLKHAQPCKNQVVRYAREEFKTPVENCLFRIANKAGITFKRDFDGFVLTEVNRIDLGDVQLVTVPGEVFPSVGREIKKYMKGKANMLVGLGNDELGYIMRKDDFSKSVFSYEQTMSVGSRVGEDVIEKARMLLEKD